ncbi:RidA family protein [Natronobeatus ordinarius]|uniref:RidA family protein n=1 Tax=Natronobeatus ordinarius TaxID=2963433 RepID=UPI0020CBE9A1|nr:RidA family protein [Natronobeatus ordinarius]
MRIIDPDGLIDTQQMHYSQAIVEDDGTLYMSGQVGWDEQFEIAGDDITSQARQVYENVELLLEEAGRDLEDVRKVTSYLVDAPANLEDYLEVWEDVFETKPFPCHTILGVESLALEEFLLEVEVEL